MRRFVTTLLACAAGLAAAFLFAYAADIARSCTGEALSCSMTKIIVLIYIPVFSVIALIAFSLAVFWKGGGARALNIALLIPLLPFLVFASYVKYSEFSVREFHDIRERDIQELLQVIIPIILTLIVPWVMLSRCVKWLEPKRMQND